MSVQAGVRESNNRSLTLLQIIVAVLPVLHVLLEYDSCNIVEIKYDGVWVGLFGASHHARFSLFCLLSSYNVLVIVVEKVVVSVIVVDISVVWEKVLSCMLEGEFRFSRLCYFGILER